MQPKNLTVLGLNLIYILNMSRESGVVTVKTFGGSGRAAGRFDDPAGITADGTGYVIVADSRNHRLQVFDRSRRYVGQVFADRPLRRPSGIHFDPEPDAGGAGQQRPALYVLNLWENTMVKYVIQRQ